MPWWQGPTFTHTVHPQHTETSSNSSTIATNSNNGVTTEGLLPHSQEPVPFLSQINPVYALLPTFLMIILIFFHLCQVVSFLQVLPPKPCVDFSPPTCVICFTHLILLHLIFWIMPGEKYKPWSCMLCGLFYSHITSFLIGPNIFFSTIFLKSLCVILCVSLPCVFCLFQTAPYELSCYDHICVSFS
jgi:hypothetical protein